MAHNLRDNGVLDFIQVGVEPVLFWMKMPIVKPVRGGNILNPFMLFMSKFHSDHEYRLSLSNRHIFRCITIAFNYL